MEPFGYIFYDVDEKQIERFGETENKTVSFDTQLMFNGHSMPKLYGQQFISQNLNTYQWYQNHTTDGLGFSFWNLKYRLVNPIFNDPF